MVQSIVEYHYVGFSHTCMKIAFHYLHAERLQVVVTGCMGSYTIIIILVSIVVKLVFGIYCLAVRVVTLCGAHLVVEICKLY